jgi:hypothetical protein
MNEVDLMKWWERYCRGCKNLECRNTYDEIEKCIKEGGKRRN